MKILYVNPGKISSGLDYVIKGPPLALLSIAAMIPKHEHEATLFDFKVEDYDEKEFRGLLKENDVVAITSMTPQISSALEVASMAKEEGLTTIIGGYHPTLDPDEVISHPAIDYVVRGEGEHTFKELIYYIDGNRDNIKKETIKGISYRDTQGDIIHNEDRPLEKNLDNFPLPRRDLLNRKKYNYMGARVMLMETSRGCPHNCKFCCIIKMWNDPKENIVYRTKSLKRIMRELYSIDYEFWDFVFFNDDNFTINVKRTKKILDAIIKSKLNKHLNFSCQTRVDTLTNNPWIVPLMKKANFNNVFLGIESVHQQSLDAMNKHSKVEMIEKATDLCYEQGISIFGGMIIGFPGETKEMVRENIDFAISLDMEFVQFTPITAFPGTEFFQEMKEKNRIATYNYKYYNLFHPMMRTNELSFIEMYQLVAEAYAKYYNNSRYLGGMLKRGLFMKRFKWLKPLSFKWMKQFALGGLKMLHQNGISTRVLDDSENKDYIERLNKWKIKLLSKKDRYRIFKKRLKDLVYRLKAQGKNLFNIRSETLKNYLLQKGTESFIKE